jgi:HAD superfamily hydrolase (TIGR01490 family)
MNKISFAVNLVIYFKKDFMYLALFDLDHTLLNGDSDVSFNQFLCDNNLVDVAAYQQFSQNAYQDYLQGKLDIVKYPNFAQMVLTQFSQEELVNLTEQFLKEKIQDKITQDTVDILKFHKKQGHQIVIITATNEFIVKPIADLLQVDDFIATQCDFANGKYTCNICGTPNYQAGKIANLQARYPDFHFKNACFYSDSFNDLPLLEFIHNLGGTSIAVNPDDKLKQAALDNKWEIQQWHK